MKYDKYAVKARRKISQYGSTAIITRIEGESYNKETNAYSGTEKKYYGAAIAETVDLSKVNGTSVLMGDVFVMCIMEPYQNRMTSLRGAERPTT